LGEIFDTDPRAAISAGGGVSFKGIDLPLNSDPGEPSQTAQAIPGDVWGFGGVWYIMGNSIHNIQLGWPCHRKAFWRRDGSGPWEFMCTWPREYWDVWRYVSGLWSNSGHIYGLFDHMVGNPIIESTDLGETWTPSSQYLDTYKGIFADPVRTSRLWILARGKLYYSDSGLNGFIEVSGLNLSSSVRAAAVDGYQGSVYAGGGNRSFAFSETDGSSWTRADIPLGGAATHDTHINELVAEQPPVLNPPDRSTMNDCNTKNGDGDPRECQISNSDQTQGYAGDPINTRTGGFSYALVDLEVQTMSMPLTFQRTYSAQAIALDDGLLGARWTHNHDTRLIFPDDPGGEASEVWFKAHSANQYRFFIGPSGEFIPDVGVQAELLEETGPPLQYRLTTASQSEYLFDEECVLIEWQDPQGRVFTYAYDLSGKLEQVTGPSGVRYLQFTYDIDDRIALVEDHTGRSVGYSYDTNDNLTGFTDPLGQTWTYQYDGNHQLTHIIDPRGVTSLRTEYESAAPHVVDFNSVTVTPYGTGQDIDPTVSIEDGGATLHLSGNAWKKIDLPYTLTYGTRLAFDFKSPAQGEIHAIGFDEDDDWSSRIGFQLYGIDSSDNVQDYNNYAGNEPVWVHYDIPVGSYFTGDVNYLIFINDHDISSPTAESYFSNIEVYETYTRAVRQYNGEDELLVELGYSAGGTTTLTDGLGNTTTHHYDPDGTLREQVDPLGGVRTRSLDPNYRLTSMTDTSGDALQMDWSEGGANLQTIVDPEGGQTDFAYDALNNLTEVVDPRGFVTSFEYNGALVTSSTDALGNTITFSYTTAVDTPQPEGLLKTITDPLGRVTFFTYDALGQIETMTDAAGNSWAYSYDDCGRLTALEDPLGRVSRSEYDAIGRLIRVIQNYAPGYSQNEQNVFNITTEFDYDEVGNLLNVTDSLGRVTAYEHDDADRVAQQTNPVGHLTTYDYNLVGNLTTLTDPLGRNTLFRYDALKRLTEVEDALGGIITRDYNADGTLASIIDSLGRATSYSYDDAKRLIQVLDPLGGMTTLDYDLTGNLVNSIDALGRVTGYVYDPLNRLIQVTDVLGGITQSAYDAVGNQVQMLDANGHLTNYTYDALNQLELITDPNSNNTHWSYDAVGNLNTTTDALGNSTAFIYDALSRLSSTTDALGNATQFAYNPLGSLTDLTDANGFITHYDIDVLNRLVGVVENVDPIAPPDAQTNVETVYGYDAVGNLLSILDANAHLRTFEHDELNRLVTETNALGNNTSYTYDPVGNRATRTDALGFITAYGYDAADRLATINYPDPDSDTSFTYDLVGNLTEMIDGVGTTTWSLDDLNRPVTVNDPFGGEVVYAYDAVGNRTSIEYPSGKHVDYSYDPGDRLVEVEDWDSQTTSYSYNAANRLIAAALPNGVTSSYNYDALGQATSIAHSLGAQTLASFVYTYDAVGNRVQAIEGVQDPLYDVFLPLVAKDVPAASADSSAAMDELETATITPTASPTNTALATVTPTVSPSPTATVAPSAAPTEHSSKTPTASSTHTPTGTPVITTNLAASWGNLAAPVPYRESGRMAQPLDALGWTTRTIDYTYDPLYRLTAADYSSGEYFHYAYDAVGNRLSQETQLGSESYTYDAADRLISLDGTAFTWDDNGNLLADGEWSYSYDHADRLTELSSPGASYSFAYNGLGDRLQGTDTSGPVNFSLDLHAGLTQVIESGSDAFLYGLGRLGGEIAGDWVYYLGDALGSVRGVSEADGGMALARWYTPFGETLEDAGQGESAYGFAGEWEDPAGLLYLRARYYATSQGRFLTKDPFMGLLALPASLHAYSYAFNNPLLYTDPSGEFPPLIIAALVGGTLIGGGFEYGRQVIQNHRNGLNGPDAWFRCIEWWDVGLGAAEGLLFSGLGILTGGMIHAVGLTGLSAFAVGGLIDVSTGMLWDMTVRGYTPSEAFVSNLLSFGMGAAIGYGLRSAGRRFADFLGDGLGTGTRGATHGGLVSPENRWLGYIPEKYRASVSGAFRGTPTVETLSDDLIVHRRWGGGSSELGSPYFSTKSYVKPGNARRYLALPDKNTANEVTSFIIPAGTTFLQGKVASQVGSIGFGDYAIGGGMQIYLPDPELAIPIR
jgi:RHS repeat-associated protein